MHYPTEDPVVRMRRPDDINTLQRLDLRTHQYPMPLEDWQGYIQRKGEETARIVLVDVMHQSVGFAMWVCNREGKFAHLLRLGVLPKWRRCGAGTLLVEACYRDSYKTTTQSGAPALDFIKIVVPELNCYPGDPDDVSEFLKHLRFEATGEILHNWREMYGDPVAGYVFRRDINVTPIV